MQGARLPPCPRPSLVQQQPGETIPRCCADACHANLDVVQRGSVIVADGVLISAAWYATRRFGEPRRSAAFLHIVANAGLLLVDHLHFQYNGLLLGVGQHLCAQRFCTPGSPGFAWRLDAGNRHGCSFLLLSEFTCLLTTD